MAFELGVFAPRTESRFIVGVCVPGACRLESKVAGLTVEPGSLLTRHPRHRRHRRRGKDATGSEPASNVRLWG